MTRNAVILGALRTPIGKNNGALKDFHPVALLARMLQELIARTGVDPELVEDHITGCVGQVGEQSVNIARSAVLAAGLPITIPGVTIDRQCGSSQQAIHFAAQAVMSGTMNLVVASGVESMSRIPIGSQTGDNLFAPFAPVAEQGIEIVHQGVSAEMVAKQWNLTREELDRFSLRSHAMAATAEDAGYFASQRVPVGFLSWDEGVRRDTSLEALAKLKPSFQADGMVTPGNSSQIADGAGALLIADETWARGHGFVPRARIASLSVVGSDPTLMLTGVIPATQKVLRNGQLYLPLSAIDVVEINEAFASVVLAWKKELNVSDEWFDDHVNPNGGAIAHGHPLGASGAILMTKLLHELERRDGKWGLQTMCEGGGMANATVIERL